MLYVIRFSWTALFALKSDLLDLHTSKKHLCSLTWRLHLKALKMIQSMLKPSLLLQNILCDHSIMTNKRRTNKETFSGTFLYLPCVSLPHVCGNVPTVQILAGFSLFVFLPLYVPAAGLLGLLPWALCVDSWFPCHLMSTSSFSNANPLPKLPEISRPVGWRTAKFHTSAR